MSKEQKLNIQKNGNYNNLRLADLEVDNYFVVKKKFAEGKKVDTKFGESYICQVEYEGVTASFFLNPKQHEKYSVCGGSEDLVKISKVEKTIINAKTKIKMIVPMMEFEKVEE